MNLKLRNFINDTQREIGKALSNSASAFVSFLRAMVLSSVSTAIKQRGYGKYKQHNACCILANGPSLKTALQDGEVHLEGTDVFCVNSFCKFEDFKKIKPRFYFLIDGAFFNPFDDRTRQQVEELKQTFREIDWDMYLCISNGCVNGGVLEGLNNEHIKVLKWNTSTFEGFTGLCHWAFKQGIGMPRCQNILNFATTAAVNMQYEKVYLYGADHSWTRDLMVNDKNVVCYGDRHVYDTNLNYIELPGKLSELLTYFSKAFEAHQVINKYAKKRAVEIINCTKHSFIDAYQREI